MKKLFRFIIFPIVLSLIIYIYARYIEPKLLNINHIDISSEFINKNSNNMKILQFSDTHLSKYFTAKDLEKLVDNINAQNPDIVVFTGDLIDHYNSYEGSIEDIWRILGSINATIGKFAVYGNHDYGGGCERVYKEIMDNSNFITLINNNITFEEYNLNIIGLDDSIFGQRDDEKIISYIDENYYNVIISHEPDIIDSFLEYNVDLFLAGHSHGGQVNIPVLRAYSLPSLAEKYIRGTYKFENYRETMLYVNIGIGTSKMPLRFMAVPEITVFNLKYKN